MAHVLFKMSQKSLLMSPLQTENLKCHLMSRRAQIDVLKNANSPSESHSGHF